MRLIKPMRDIDNMRLYSKAGFHTMITGMESASPKVLRHMKKYSNIQGMRDIFNNIREINNDSETRYPIRILLQLIIGYINESEEDFQMTMDFVEEYSDIIYEVTTCSLFLSNIKLKLAIKKSVYLKIIKISKFVAITKVK